jgi:hypothetical protein
MPPTQPSVGIITVRVIMKVVRTHWIWFTSARRLVIMVGREIFSEPNMIEVISDPRITARLIIKWGCKLYGKRPSPDHEHEEAEVSIRKRLEKRREAKRRFGHGRIVKIRNA